MIMVTLTKLLEIRIVANKRSESFSRALIRLSEVPIDKLSVLVTVVVFLLLCLELKKLTGKAPGRITAAHSGNGCNGGGFLMIHKEL